MGKLVVTWIDNSIRYDNFFIWGFLGFVLLISIPIDNLEVSIDF